METFRRAHHRTALILILIFVLLAAGIVAAGSLNYQNYAKQYIAEVEGQLSAVADLKLSELVEFRKERLGDAAILFKNTSFSALIRRILANPRDADAQRQVQEWIGNLRAHYQYDRVSLLDTQGVERTSAPVGPEPVAAIISQHASEVLRSGLVAFQDFYRDEHDQRICLAVLVPVLDEQNGSRPLGVVVLRIDPEVYLYPFIRRWPIPSRSAETLLVRRDGNDVLFLNQLRFRANSALNLRVPLTTGKLPAAQAVLGREGLVEGVDYRGVRVIAHVRRVPESPWFLVARMDTSEVYAPLRERLWEIVGLAGVLLLGAAGAMVFVWRRQTMRFYRDRYQVSEALRESEDRYRSLFEQSGDSILLLELCGGPPLILDANPAALRAHGYSREEMVGQPISLIEPGITRPAGEERLRLMAEGKPVYIRHRRKDGSVFDVESVAREIQVGGRNVVLAVERDITERKHTEARLIQAQKMESIGRLAGGVAHDFNNLLTVINGYSQLLVDKLSAADPLRAGLEEIHKAGERAAGLTRQLLAFSRKQILEPRSLDLNRVVEEMRPMLKRLVGEAVEMRVELEAESATVHADPHQLEQVIMNLVLSARDAMPGGGRLLIETAGVERDQSYVQSHPEARPGRYVMLAVSDSGVGMDEATRQRIFEPFFTTKGVGQGTGLGLSTIQGIVAQSGGYIEVYSEPGRGTTFRIYLPALAEAAAEAARPAAVPALGGKETVLVVEDQAEVRDYAAAVLKAYGYRVIKAENAGEAMLLGEREPGRIHLVLTDVVMPILSGRELADRLEKLRPGIRVLFMSGYTDNVILHQGILEQGAQFIPKPFSPEQLAIKIREVLGPPAPAPRILVADDEAGVRAFLRAALEEGGYQVTEAADGRQALEEARAGHVDLVITDLVMPKQEGIETIQTLRKEMPAIGIIAITGKFESRYLKIVELLGADAVLTKPVSAGLLLAKVAEVLKLRR